PNGNVAPAPAPAPAPPTPNPPALPPPPPLPPPPTPNLVVAWNGPGGSFSGWALDDDFPVV
ncbi:hypothetical protein FRC17_000524, partial [Serendipita sp. 399]